MSVMDPWPEDQEFCRNCGHAMVRRSTALNWWTCLICTDALHQAFNEIVATKLRRRPPVERD